MGTHDHHRYAGAALDAHARAAFERSGERWTDMRADVFAALAAATRPVSAYDIAEAVSGARSRRVAANSIYRILDLFVATNLAHKVESANAYFVNAHPDCVHDCVFLLCDACGTAAHLDDDTLGTRLRDTATAAGFVPRRAVLEVRGLCTGCR